MNYQYKGDKIKPIDLSKKLTPKAIQETCDNICSEAIKEYPKVLEIQAKLIGKIDKKKKTKLVKKFTKECHSKCEKTLHEAKEIIPMMDKLQKKQDKSKKKKKKKKKTKRGGCSSRGGGKKRTVHRNRRLRRSPRRTPSPRTLKFLKGLSYHDLKNLSSDKLRKYLKLCGRTAPDWGGGYTDKVIISILRRYISDKNKSYYQK